MREICRIDKSNRERFIGQIKSDVIKHVFAFYDVQHDPEHTTTYAAFDNDVLLGYILIYSATDVPSVVLEGQREAAKRLMTHAPRNHFILHAPRNLLPIVKTRFHDSESYVENWMLVRRNEANFFNSKTVKRLQTKEDALMLAKLILGREDRPKRALKRYVDRIAKMPIYGVLKESELVSYAGSFIQLPEVWMIGGVYTDPKHRNSGYALLATSAVTKNALAEAAAAALFVRSDNYPAIRVYEKIGYRKIGEKLWVDVGTGMRP